MKRQLLIATLVFGLSALSTPAFADVTVTNGILSVSPSAATRDVSGKVTLKTSNRNHDS